MFSKLTLISLVVGALSVNALVVPVARSPSPEPQGESPLSSSTIFYRGLIFPSFTAGLGGFGSVSTSGGYGGVSGGSNGGFGSARTGNTGYYGGGSGGSASG